ncbi:hypothetical protein D3C81_1470210 [compost metagenome]
MARFQFSKQHGAVALAVVDVQVGARSHHHGTGYGRPVIVKAEAVPLLAQAQLACSSRQAGHQRIARVAPVRDHRHRARALGCEKAHFMVRLLPVGTRVKHAPAELALVSEVGELAMVVRHVHVLVGKTLVRDMLHAGTQGQLLAIALGRQHDGLVDAFKHAGQHFVAMAIFIAVTARVGTAVADAEHVAGSRGVHAGRHAVVDAASRHGKAALREQARAGLGEHGRVRLHFDGTADAVAARADGSHTRDQADALHLLRIDIR